MHENFHGPQLRERGYAGSNQDIWNSWLRTKGYKGKTTHGLEGDWLLAQGYDKGTLNDRYFRMYRDAGLTGALDDMGSKWVVPEGGTNPEGGDPIEDPLWDDVLFYHSFSALDPDKGGAGPAKIVGAKVEIADHQLWDSPSLVIQPTVDTKNGLVVPIDMTLDPLEGFTVECWGKTTDEGIVNFPTWLQLSNRDTGSMLYFGASDARGFTMGGVYTYITSGRDSIPHDNWTHVAYVVEKESAKIYSEGKLIKRDRVSGTAVPFLAKELSVGYRSHGITEYAFRGKLDDIRITKGVRYTEDFEPPKGPVKVPTP